MRSLKRIELVVVCVVVLLSVACGGGTATSPTSVVSVPFSTVDLRVGSGAEATTGRTVSVNYTGWVYSTSAADNKGTQFDTSIGKSPLVFTVGAGRVIRGFDQGVVGMKVGGQRRIVIPPDLGYGSAGAGSIPPNATIIFDVDLLAVQ